MLPMLLVPEGPKAGGHLGFSAEELTKPEYQLEVLLPQVVQAAQEIGREAGKAIPVIAAGGVYTGADIYALQQLGASAVQMATRFVATEECDAHDKFKQAYLNCKQEDIAIIQSPVGLPGRAISNDFLTQAKAGLKQPKVCARHCITTCKRGIQPLLYFIGIDSGSAGTIRAWFCIYWRQWISDRSYLNGASADAGTGR